MRSQFVRFHFSFCSSTVRRGHRSVGIVPARSLFRLTVALEAQIICWKDSFLVFGLGPVAGFQFFPKQFHKVLQASVLRRFFEICAAVVFRWFAMLKLMYLFMHLLNASMKGRAAKQSLD